MTNFTARRRLLQTLLCSSFFQKSHQPHLTCKWICLPNNITPSTSFSSGLDEHWQQYNRANVPILRQNAPDLSQGIPYKFWKEFLDERIDEELKQRNFPDAIKYWKKFLDNTQSVHGIFQLIDYSILNYRDNEVILKAQIETLWQYSRTILHASDFLAYLIVAMTKNGHLEEAIYFAKKFTVFGTSFLKPLKIVAEKSQTKFFVEFAELLEKVYLNIPKRAKRKKFGKNNTINREIEEIKRIDDGANNNEKMTGNHEEEAPKMGNADDDDERRVALVYRDGKMEKNNREMRFQSLIWIWEPPKRNWARQRRIPYGRQRMHKIDVQKLDRLMNNFVMLWIEKTVEYSSGNEQHWKCLMNFIERNKLNIGTKEGGAIHGTVIIVWMPRQLIDQVIGPL